MQRSHCPHTHGWLHGCVVVQEIDVYGHHVDDLLVTCAASYSCEDISLYSLNQQFYIDCYDPAIETCPSITIVDTTANPTPSPTPRPTDPDLACYR